MRSFLVDGRSPYRMCYSRTLERKLEPQTTLVLSTPKTRDLQKHVPSYFPTNRIQQSRAVLTET